MTKFNRWIYVFSIFSLLNVIGFTDADWQRDFEWQQPQKRPHLEARYASSLRDGFSINAERYAINIELKNANRHAVSQLNVAGRVLLQNGIFEIQDSDGNIWSSAFASKPSRINLYRRGPYYNEIHWMDVAFCNSDGTALPVRGEIVFYSYAESCRIGVVLHATENVQINRISCQWNLADFAQRIHIPLQKYSNECVAVSGENQSPLIFFPTTEPKAAIAMSEPQRLKIDWCVQNELLPDAPQQFDVGFVILGADDAWGDLRAELEPISSDNLELKDGLKFSYDPVRGDYVASSHNTGGFSYHYYENRNDYRRARVRMKNGSFARKVYLRHEVGSGARGQVECGVTLDENGELLPILNQISKNFAGEKEEKFYNPTDAAFSETFIPIYLEPNENCELTSLHLYQDWGNHPLKQFSSLGAWMDYFHMSTGVTETTCYVPFQYYTGISIADLRGMSGRMWESQPQHDNVGGHIFMEYQAADRPGKRQVIEYLGTSYHSTGPNWAHITFNYLSSDGRIRTTLETFEYPQLDELRNFIRLKVTALDDVPIRDWATDFRIMQIDSRTQSLRYQTISYIDENDNAGSKKLVFDDSFSLSGVPLSSQAPAAVLWNSPKGNNAVIVEDWRGVIGGEPLKGFALSCEGRKNGDSNMILVPQSETNGLLKGDEFEIDLFIMPYGQEGDDESAAYLERERYGLNPVRISDVNNGNILSHFPPRMRLTDNASEFKIQGGAATVGVLVEGLDSYNDWGIEQWISNEWRVIPHHDSENEISIKGEGQQRYVCDDGTYGVVFRIKLDGTIQRYRVSRGSGK